MTHSTTASARASVDLAVNTMHDVLVNAQQAHQDALNAMAAAVLHVEETKQTLAALEDEYAVLIAAQEALGRADGPVSGDDLTLFLDYAKDAGNWSGMPLLGGNVGSDDPKSVEALEAAGLITTQEDREPLNGRPNVSYWITFTEAGVALAKQHGVEV